MCCLLEEILATSYMKLSCDTVIGNILNASLLKVLIGNGYLSLSVPTCWLC